MELQSTQDFMLGIASRLTKAGFKMRDLAGKANLSESSLSDAKNGRTMFTFEKANMINKAVDLMISKKE